MDEHNNDPYEQQLYAVFQSCLTKGETELQEDNWLSLCHKLHLTEQSDELKSCIQLRTHEKQSVSFQEFRTALLTLLGKTQELDTRTEKDVTTESQSGINSCSIDRKKCNSLAPNNSDPDVDIPNVKTGERTIRGYYSFRTKGVTYLIQKFISLLFRYDAGR